MTEHLLRTLTREQSDALAGRIAEHFHREGFGFWAVEAPGLASFVGMVGISIPSYAAPFTPCVEVGWRLSRRYWGQGFGTEAALAALEFGSETVDLPEIVALTVPHNGRSRAVMAEFGMVRAANDDFDHPLLPVGHPLLPVGHPLKRHVLYRLSKQSWMSTKGLPRSPG